ncbi:Tpsab1p [Tyrophagus putrescentiae]|nr:Tpsab1p [Tyrophagus putrescentiae]
MIGQEKLRQIMWPVLTDENNSIDKTLISNLGIINGDKVAEGKYRFTASLQLSVKEDWAFFCGGSILNDEYILTAAHCCFMQAEKDKNKFVALKPENLRVVLGSHNLLKSNEDHHFPVASIHSHADFIMEHPEKGNDVAVYKLAKKINFKDKMLEKSCLPPTGKVEPKGDDCVVMGWGLTTRDTEHGRGSTDLLEFHVGMLSDEDCKKPNFRGYDYQKLICASQEKGGSCNGDSGGVYLCPVKDDPDSWLQYGIVSFGGDNCNKDTPVYYTRVSTYIDWIKQHVGE